MASERADANPSVHAVLGFLSLLISCAFPHTCFRAQVCLWNLLTCFQARLSVCPIVSLAQLPFACRLLVSLCAGSACFTLARTAVPGSSLGLRLPGPSALGGVRLLQATLASR